MDILGIESSCDETAAAVVCDGTTILSSVISTSHELHKKYGGILPEIASREQLKYMLPVIENALYEAYPHNTFQEALKKIDAIAITIGPGLIGSLLIGVESAKTISMISHKPLIPVNHVLAHIFANIVDSGNARPSFPAVALVVSGGHTELFLMNSENELTWIGGTVDDAAGEAFDKGARLLGFGNGGGKAIETAAEEYLQRGTDHQHTLSLPRPLLHHDSLQFSFSGLKTALQREWKKYININSSDPVASAFFAYELQEAITDVLVHKTLRAAQKHNVHSILLGGGVSANNRLREKFIQHTPPTITVHVPPIELCTDNAVVIASYAYFHQLTHNYREISATPTLSVE